MFEYENNLYNYLDQTWLEILIDITKIL